MVKEKLKHLITCGVVLRMLQYACSKDTQIAHGWPLLATIHMVIIAAKNRPADLVSSAMISLASSQNRQS
jgi:hypothetical protein